MKKSVIFLFSALIVCLILWLTHSPAKEINTERVVSFYEVPLVCGAAPDIACGSRIKPLFIEASKYSKIKETWINRPGTIVAFVWNDVEPDEKLSEMLFQKFSIEAKLLSDANLQNQNFESSINSINSINKEWYSGMEVDQLSIEEAGIIAKSTVNKIHKAKLLTESEAADIQSEIERYFKKELVKVRSFDELKSDETERKWKENAFQIFINHVGKKRTDKIAEFMGEKENCEEINKKSCCDKTSTKDCCKKK